MSETAVLWSAVDELTKPRHVRLVRDDGAADWTTLPGLWWQLEAALDTGQALSGSRGSKYRTPLNIDALELSMTIQDVLLDALNGHGLQPRTEGASPERIRVVMRQAAAEATYGIVEVTPVPPPFRVLFADSLRTLASAVAATLDDDLIGWWTYRVRSWCRQIDHTLRLTEQPQPRRIRDTRCPTCSATHVTLIAGVDGTERVPALLIDFAEGMIRAASCSACGSTWFRGDALLALTDQLSGQPPPVYAPLAKPVYPPRDTAAQLGLPHFDDVDQVG